jgi:hypothetical protein
MRKRGVPSPDRAEAICHTFFMPVITATYDGEEEYTEFRETSRPNAMTGY